MSSVARIYGGDVMFSKSINAVLIADFANKYERVHNRHWPSEASVIVEGSTIGACMREKYFQRMGYPEDKEVSIVSIRKMKIGKVIEQAEIALGKAAGIWVADDVPFQFTHKNITISGKLDAIYKNKAGDNICVEYKTGSGWNFVKRVFGGKGANSAQYAMPKMEHVLQVILYLYAMPELKYGIIYCIDRESMATIEHKIELKEDHILINGKRVDITIKMMLDRYEELTNYLESKTLPPPDYTPAYREEDVEALYAKKIVSKYEYDRWHSTGELPGEIRCAFCQWMPTCRGICAGDNTIEDVIVDDQPLLVF